MRWHIKLVMKRGYTMKHLTRLTSYLGVLLLASLGHAATLEWDRNVETDMQDY